MIEDGHSRAHHVEVVYGHGHADAREHVQRPHHFVGMRHAHALGEFHADQSGRQPDFCMQLSTKLMKCGSVTAASERFTENAGGSRFQPWDCDAARR